jgi:hypothetical protein
MDITKTIETSKDGLFGVEGEIKRLESRVRIAVETSLLRESVRVQLSRLATLDPDRAHDYEEALGAVGEVE